MMITDIILMAYQCVHTINKKVGRQGICEVKHDMHRTYDRFEWKFMKEMTLKLGFDIRCVNLMMELSRRYGTELTLILLKNLSIDPSNVLRQGGLMTHKCRGHKVFERSISTQIY